MKPVSQVPAPGAVTGELSSQRALAGWLPARLAAEKPAITVIGDVMLDGWWSGSIERLCREAPAPVVDVDTREFAPGGAANTAMNLAALGARVAVVGIIGTDDAGATLRRQLEQAGIDVRHLHAHPDMVTTTKIRISSGGQVMLRIDDSATAVPAGALAGLAAVVRDAVVHQDAVMVCDYGTGVLAGPVRAALLAALAPPEGAVPEVAADDGGAPARPLTVVDAHDPLPWAPLRPDLVTPNAQEAARLLGIRLTGGPGASGGDDEAPRRPAVRHRRGGCGGHPGPGRDRAVLGRRRHAPDLGAARGGEAGVRRRRHLRGCADAGPLGRPAADREPGPCPGGCRRGGAPPGTSVCTTAELVQHLASFADTALAAEN